MLDVAIVGAGVCGLALARRLVEQGRDVAIFEARERLGGRVESAAAESGNGARVDLGPTWYWPRTQPLMSELVESLDLRDFPQHDPGHVLVMQTAGEAPEVKRADHLHGYARRLSGGMDVLVQALSAQLPAERIFRGHTLRRAAQRDGYVELSFGHSTDSGDDGQAAQERVVEAQTLVLAMPPRLVDKYVHFEPALPQDLREALGECATWMAAQAKSVTVFDRASWREAGWSGNAFVQHEQAVLGEIFDACDPEYALSALAGFVALSPEARRSYETGLPLLVRNQLTQLFGELTPRAQHYRDWSLEPYTCCELDVQDLMESSIQPQHPVARALLREPHWDGALLFAGSETAEQEAGYLEGALHAAQRVYAWLDAAVSPSSPKANGQALRAWLDQRLPEALADYQQRVASSLAEHDSHRVTQRALVAVVEQVFDAALLSALCVRMELEADTAAIGADEQAALRDFLAKLISEALSFNRRSCALSNFADEHRPSQDYLQDILRDLNAIYTQFERSAQRPAAPSGS